MKATTVAERPGAVTLQGRPLTVLGDALRPGDGAPDFEVVDNNWQRVRLSDFSGKVRLISAVPSLETRVCDAQTRRFNEETAGLGDDVVVLTLSADLPYTQKRWCGAAGIERVQVFSDHRSMDFADKYGVHIKGLRLLQRSVFVVDKNDNIVHVEYVPVFGDEPNYQAAVNAAKEAANVA